MGERNNKLYELFDEWKNNDEMKGEKFYPDGFLAEYYDKEIQILFILKESDEGDDDGTEDLKYTNFWAYRMVNKYGEVNEYGKTDISGVGNMLMNRLKYIREYVDKKKLSSNEMVEKDGLPYYCLSDCAFMNINKSGGGAKANDNNIKKIREKDACYIKKEIDIIKPKYIVAMGANMKDLLGDELLNKIDNKTIIVWHPSYRVSNDKYHAQVVKEFGKIK